MSVSRKKTAVIVLAALALSCVVAVLALRRWAWQSVKAPRADAVPLAVLGNSDSHAYQDSVWFPPDGNLRGGSQRKTSLQWTESLAALRSDSLDQGPWGVHGGNARLSRALAMLGVELRTPQKMDFAFNLATSGARCEHLRSPLGQLRNLRALLRRDPQAWEQGVVVIRIGINDIGRRDVLDAVAAGRAGEADALVDACVAEIAQTVADLRTQSPNLAVILVGIADNSLWPPNLDLWRSERETANLQAFLDRFDASLRQIAERTPRAAFLDDRAWFRRSFGARDRDGSPQLRELCVGGVRLSYRQGDDLGSAILADGHAGSLLNLLWAAEVVETLRGLGFSRVPTITQAELDQFAASLAARAGVAPDCAAQPETAG